MARYTTTQLAEIIAASVAVSGSATLSARGEGTPTYGYGVAIAGLGVTVDAGEVVVPAITAYIEARATALNMSGRYVGAWRDTGGTLYLDVTRVIGDEATALEIARCDGELAIWDYAEDREIRVTY